MAVLTNLALAASLLSSFVAAAPLVNAPRALRTYTHYETAWVTVAETTTLWVDPAQQTVIADAPDTAVDAPETPAAATATATLTTTTAAVFAEATPSTTSTEAPPAVTPTTPTTFATSTVPAETAAAETATATPSAVNIQPKSDASTTNTCEGTGAECVGDVTHWDGGLGACGWTVDTNNENVIALPYGLMGTESNGNPYCGRSVTLFNPTSGTTVQATVGDKCMGCVGRSIDCTNKLFSAITDGQGDGRMSGIQWYFNN